MKEEKKVLKISKNEAKYQKIGKIFIKKKSGITLIALVITIALNAFAWS